MNLFGKTLTILALTAVPALAAPPPVSAGPGTITCTDSTHCQLGIGSPAKIKYVVDATALSAEDKTRLKTCVAGKPVCVATVTGTENGDPLKVKAASIKWYN
jgi:hypothetical protein